MSVNRFAQLTTALAVSGFILTSSPAADSLMDRINMGSEFGDTTSQRRIADYDSSLSRVTGEADTANPYTGQVLNRVHDCGFKPQTDHNLFMQRIKDGVTLYRERGVTEYQNKYNMFKRITTYLPGGSLGMDSGKPVIAMFMQSRQVFLIYRVYEAKDGRSTFLCYYNSQGKIGAEQRTLHERLFTLKGYKLRNGYKITEGGADDRALNIGLIDPATKLEAEGAMDFLGNGGSGMFADASPVVGGGANPDLDWERNPPHPDNIGYGENQVEAKAKGKTDILQSIMEPVMFGAKIGLGAYMLKEVFSNKKKKDDDEDEWGYGNGMGMGYGPGMGMGYGYGMEYGGGYVMGGGMPGMNPGMYPGMYPGMNPGMYPGMMPGMMPGQMPGMMPGMPPMQQPYYPGVYPGTMPGGSYPGMGPMPGPDYTQPMPGGYPGAGPMTPPGYGPTYPPMQNLPPGTSQPYQTQPAPDYGYAPQPIQPYAPTGTTSLAPTGAPMAPSSSTVTPGMIPVITQNDNTYLSTTL